MAQLQYLGVAPERRKSPVGEAIKSGVESYFGAREKRMEREVELEKISYDKKKQAADLIIKQTENATPQQKRQIGDTQAGELVVDVYGQEAFDTWQGVAGKGKAAKLANVDTWISTKKKPSAMGLPIPLNKSNMDTSIALELSDANWRETYPDRAKAFDLAYPTAPKKEKGGWPWGKKDEYKSMSEQDLFNKAKEGDQKAIEEAVSRGYAVGGR